MTEENLENKKERRTRKTREGGQKIRKTIQIELKRKNIAHIVKKYKFSKKRNKLNLKVYD